MLWDEIKCHNPYFNRWFSAIKIFDNILRDIHRVTILILIDGFLQYNNENAKTSSFDVTILILIDGFLQF